MLRIFRETLVGPDKSTNTSRDNYSRIYLCSLTMLWELLLQPYLDEMVLPKLI
jgi:hypothetical protein